MTKDMGIYGYSANVFHHVIVSDSVAITETGGEPYMSVIVSYLANDKFRGRGVKVGILNIYYTHP
jgi:hypothetical protein